MEKNIKNRTKFSTSMYIDETILDAIDRWVLKKNKEETGGRFSRNSFLEHAIMAKVEEYGLMEDDAKR